MSTLQHELEQFNQKLYQTLDRLVPTTQNIENHTIDAIRYSLLCGGKALRAFLVKTSSQLFSVPEKMFLPVAAAVEMIHTYTLIHDDLPAMDDDDLRRGQPSNHQRFDEATAILAGDALQAKSFETLASTSHGIPPEIRCALIYELASACGVHGLVEGQMIDLQIGKWAKSQKVNMDMVIHMQSMKTAALFKFCCHAGALLGNADSERTNALITFGANIGIAFQITDDILDVEGQPDKMGKKTDKDHTHDKITTISLVGLESARARAHDFMKRAIDSLEIFGKDAHTLRQIGQYCIKRDK